MNCRYSNSFKPDSGRTEMTGLEPKRTWSLQQKLNISQDFPTNGN
jgi:hypothetical protein